MKNTVLRAAILMAGLLPVASTAFAQTGVMTYYGGSNSNPDYLFSASIGSINYSPGASHSFVGFNIRPGATNNTWKIGTDSNNNGGAMLIGGLSGSLTFVTVPAYAYSSNGSNGAQSLTDSQILSYQQMQISSTGQVIIGKTLPTTQTDYKLAVGGKFVAQSMYVTNPNTWADYVFAPTYKVMPLPELETYVRTNKHLPYIPSAKEVETKGYNVAEMDANLLRTVEELTLQVIELRKQVEQLKAAKASN